jgi:DNA-binding IscR family transcriptional regulator
VEPEDITLARVIEILDGPLFLALDCLNPGSEPCAECSGSDCALRKALGSADRSAWKVLELVSVRDLVRERSGSSQTIQRAPRNKDHGIERGR